MSGINHFLEYVKNSLEGLKKTRFTGQIQFEANLNQGGITHQTTTLKTRFAMGTPPAEDEPTLDKKGVEILRD